jgi:hypothetical protein
MNSNEMQKFPFWAFVQRDRRRIELFYFTELRFPPNGERFYYTHHYYLYREGYGHISSSSGGYFTRANLKSHFKGIDELSEWDRRLWIKVIFGERGY